MCPPRSEFRGKLCRAPSGAIVVDIACGCFTKLAFPLTLAPSPKHTWDDGGFRCFDSRAKGKHKNLIYTEKIGITLMRETSVLSRKISTTHARAITPLGAQAIAERRSPRLG
jgi:hypothetical protein